jgi:hypothetical protein
MTVTHCKTTTGECVSRSSGATTAAPPPRVVWTTRDGYYGPCDSNSNASCYYFTVHITGFPAGSYSITCFPGTTWQRSGGTISSGGYTGEYTKAVTNCVAANGGEAEVDVGGTRGSGRGW